MSYLTLIVGLGCLAFLAWWQVQLRLAQRESETLTHDVWSQWLAKRSSAPPLTPAMLGPEVLHRIWLFSELSDAELGSLARIARRKRYEARRVIAQQGERGGDFYAVLRGHLKVLVTEHRGRELVMDLLQPGEVFGEVELLDGQARPATIVSLDACELLVIRRADFLSLLQQVPSMAAGLLTVMARRTRHLTERAADSAFLDVRSRLARRLVDLGDQFGTPLGQRQVEVSVRLSQQELSDMVQGTRDVVTKCLTEWTREGIIGQRGRQLVIRDRDRLQAIAS